MELGTEGCVGGLHAVSFDCERLLVLALDAKLHDLYTRVLLERERLDELLVRLHRDELGFPVSDGEVEERIRADFTFLECDLVGSGDLDPATGLIDRVSRVAADHDRRLLEVKRVLRATTGDRLDFPVTQYTRAEAQAELLGLRVWKRCDPFVPCTVPLAAVATTIVRCAVLDELRSASEGRVEQRPLAAVALDPGLTDEHAVDGTVAVSVDAVLQTWLAAGSAAELDRRLPEGCHRTRDVTIERGLLGTGCRLGEQADRTIDVLVARFCVGRTGVIVCPAGFIVLSRDRAVGDGRARERASLATVPAEDDIRRRTDVRVVRHRAVDPIETRFADEQVVLLEARIVRDLQCYGWVLLGECGGVEVDVLLGATCGPGGAVGVESFERDVTGCEVGLEGNGHLGESFVPVIDLHVLVISAGLLVIAVGLGRLGVVLGLLLVLRVLFTGFLGRGFGLFLIGLVDDDRRLLLGYHLFGWCFFGRLFSWRGCFRCLFPFRGISFGDDRGVGRDRCFVTFRSGCRSRYEKRETEYSGRNHCSYFRFVACSEHVNFQSMWVELVRTGGCQIVSLSM